MRKCLWGTTKKKLEELFNQMDAVQDEDVYKRQV